MENKNGPHKNPDDNPGKEDSLKRGEEAIKMHKEVVNKGKPKEQQDKEEEKDAEQWHNEG